MKWSATKWVWGLAVLLMVGVSFVGGAAFALWTRPASAVSEASADLSAFWKAWELLDSHFVDSSASSTQAVATSTPGVVEERIWGAIGGLVDSYGDPYTVFLPPEENKLFEDDIRGNFGGVGMEIGVREEFIAVIAPLPETPAAKAGLKPGDKILEINDESTYKMSTTKALKLIRGEVGTTVTMEVISDGAKSSRTVTITRALIKVPTIKTEQLADGTFVIKLSSFGATAPKEFRTALEAFSKAKTDRLIIDLRGNPGGYLNAAIDIASWFLPKGLVVAREDRGSNGAPIAYESKGYGSWNGRLKMAILVDEGSASAAEILAGALREHGVAKLVGEQTFGKGSVQEIFPITKDTSLKITVAKWLTPNGISISHNGLKPDLEVKNEAATSTTAKNPAKDAQLEAALKLLKNSK